MPAGLVVYQGPSRLDGAPVVGIITRDSTNAKTGTMAQAWILRADIPPMDAVRSGEDRSICGNCVHRSGSEVGRSCYVAIWRGPIVVWNAWRAGNYQDLEPAAASRELAGEQVRLAAYGDPAAVPFDVWRSVLLHVDGWTGYTHQWRTCDQRLRAICMASVESEAEADQATALGWRFFRARLAVEPVRADEIRCPASEEAGRRLTCQACGLCRGLARGAARSISIIGHGHFVRAFEQLKQRASAHGQDR
jgi:hypothetical protein